ncbi:MAG TPA: DUF2381 family protein [Myxococcales bacterium]|nr:DUF2381 family protein [Myxococcales bacterium]
MAAGLLVASMTAAAQPLLPEAKLEVDREVVVTGEPDERPVVVYGAANIVVQLIFEAPLQRTDAGIALRLSGGDVRPHPYLDNALVLTPSSALASGPAVPLHVKLVDGGVPFLLTFQPGRIDHVLRVLQRPLTLDAGAGVSRTAFQESLGSTAGAIFKDKACAPLQSQLVRAKKVDQGGRGRSGPDVLVCATGTLNYLRIPRKQPGCAVASARLLREGRDEEVLFLESVKSERESWQVLAVWSPPQEARGFELLLLAADGTLCEKHADLTLGPGDSP